MKRLLPLLVLLFSTIICHAGPKPLPGDDDSKIKIPSKTASDKFIYLSNVGIDLDKKNAVEMYYVNFAKSDKITTVEGKIEYAETHRSEQEAEEQKAAAKKKSGPEKEKLNKEDDKVENKYTTLGNDLYAGLKAAGFIDTINHIFQDENNTLMLEGKVSTVHIFAMSGYKDNPCCSSCYKAKVFIKWYIKNRYSEVLDSFSTTGLSENYVRDEYSYYGISSIPSSRLESMMNNAVRASFVKLYASSVFKKFLKSETVPAYTEAALQLNKPMALVSDKGDASSASVILKRDDQGHGSGFAITQDGYILTNYHVIATKNSSKLAKITAILSGGEELEATIVRFNKARDIALLKINKSFTKAFALSSERKFKNLMDVYTVGAPKSIELGQTFTSGLISNERNANNNQLLQLSMPVNFGNSGGPLFDQSGVLHGVIVAKLVGESTEGISFAIPAYKIGEYLNISY